MAWSNSANPSAWQPHLSVPVWLFLALVLIAGRAEASCGDYLALPDASQQSHYLLGAEQAASHEIPNQQPCSGPNCQGSRPQTPESTPPTPNQISERLLDISVQPERELMVVRGFSPMFAATPQDGFAPELLRPPSYAL